MRYAAFCVDATVQLMVSFPERVLSIRKESTRVSLNVPFNKFIV